ncbi:hypothetical protein FPZ42_14795 [Mucilaginibacter achroorhodeus]|uniref:Uncharacterized protein n=1 Tax=Mucilaginibacter achroorhodeus TaxID=2599294 RepID=A0A563U0E8_9SPHI|nr:hypothetical protein [Mucilaginibacter achroorhodeus]TWR25013.1 hypothetical protein FPZ42_14795 [Mucilaginibacter achroorhodeus]
MDYQNAMLSVENKSPLLITVLYSNATNVHTENNVAFYTADWVTIAPDSVGDIKINGRADAWHEYIESGKEKKLFIYFFAADSLKRYDGRYSMDQLCAMKKYLKVNSYTEDQLSMLPGELVTIMIDSQHPF